MSDRPTRTPRLTGLSTTTLLLTTTVIPRFPAGPRLTWISSAGRAFDLTVLDGANRYVIVALDPDLAEEYDDDLEALRCDVANAAGWVSTTNEPKLGCVAATADTDRPLRFRVRQNAVQGWHPAMAASGILALAAAAATPGTVVAELLGASAAGPVTIGTPGGDRSFDVSADGAGLLVEYPLSSVSPVLTEGTDGSASVAVPLASGSE